MKFIFFTFAFVASLNLSVSEARWKKKKTVKNNDGSTTAIETFTTGFGKNKTKWTNTETKENDGSTTYTSERTTGVHDNPNEDDTSGDINVNY